MEKVNVYLYGEQTPIYIHANSNDYIGKMIKHYSSFYEYQLLDFLKTTFPNQKNILDIGANIGNHSLFFAKYMVPKGRKVYSFEPFPKNAELFKHNLANYSDVCTLYEVALSDKDGKLPLYNCEHDNFGGFSLETQNGSFVVKDEIDVVKLDNFNFDDITLMKIDVENHENEVLMGARDTILRNKPVVVLENSYHYFKHIFPDPEPHQKVFQELGYTKLYSNAKQSAMDIWIPVE